MKMCRVLKNKSLPESIWGVALELKEFLASALDGGDCQFHASVTLPPGNGPSLLIR
jgi:hypothetical protein